MFGLIIFAYPAALIIGLWIGAKAQLALPAIVRSALIGGTLALVSSLEFVGGVPIRQLLTEMTLPATAICAGLGGGGALISRAVRRRLKNLGFWAAALAMM